MYDEELNFDGIAVEEADDEIDALLDDIDEVEDDGVFSEGFALPDVGEDEDAGFDDGEVRRNILFSEDPMHPVNEANDSFERPSSDFSKYKASRSFRVGVFGGQRFGG